MIFLIWGLFGKSVLERQSGLKMPDETFASKASKPHGR